VRVKLTDEKLDAIKQCLQQGLEYMAIKQITGISRGTVSTVAITLGMRRQGKKAGK
jgi:uncharacterized protein YerC